MSKPTKVRVLGLIVDATRRWARKRKKGAKYGHTRAFRTVLPEIEEAAFSAGVEHVLYFWASEDNFGARPKEVAHVCELLKEDMRRRLCQEFPARFRLIGNWELYHTDPEIRTLADQLQEKTKNIEGKGVTICFGYHGQTEIVEAVKALIRAGAPADKITCEMLEKYLWTSYLPPVDLIIRTGSRGDPHNSAGFLMWKSAYSQLRFIKTQWPDFTPEHLRRIIRSVEKSERRFGA